MPRRAKRPDALRKIQTWFEPITAEGNRSMADLQKIVDDLSSLTVLEAAELAKLLEEKWGVSAAAAVAVAGPAAGAVQHQLPLKKRPSSRSFSPLPARRRSKSSRKSVPSPASASRKPRTSSKARPSRSRRA